MSLEFFDRSGHAIAYSEDDEHIYLFGGQPVAYLVSGAIYNYRGEQLGWYENGWIRDKDGRCVAFSELVSGGPPRPTMGLRPAKVVRQVRPQMEPRTSRSLRPIHSNAWSGLSVQDFFANRAHRWPGDIKNDGGKIS